MCGQVWWPILGICPLHLTHPSAHSQQWTHTWSSGQPYCGARGAVGGSVPCSRVSPQSWYWRWREHLLFTPPTDNPCRTWESNRQPLGYKSNSLTIRPRLPHGKATASGAEDCGFKSYLGHPEGVYEETFCNHVLAADSLSYTNTKVAGLISWYNPNKVHFFLPFQFFTT